MTSLGVWIPSHSIDRAVPRAIVSAPWAAAAGVHLTDDLSRADAVLAYLDKGDDTHAAIAAIRDASGQAPILLTGPALAGADGQANSSGVRAGGALPAHEVRLRRGPVLDPRGEGDLLVHAAWPTIDKVADDVAVLATANVAFTDHAVLTWRPSTAVGAFTFDGDALWHDRDILRTLQRWIRHATGRAEAPTARVGLLAYGAIGHEHLSAVQAVPGLELVAVCDRSDQRLRAAEADAPGVITMTDGDAMLARDDIDVVIVSTPPDTHAMWAMRALDRGKHVVLEKPMALSSADGDAVLAAAEAAHRTALVYQNRRWDPDYLTLRRAIQDGRIGDVFHIETFVGGYGHPCNYWHSDASVSGGAIFDWGSHFLDQILGLMASPVVSVSARNHTGRWFDVTNADHARVTLTFADSTEATFIHSDLAAALKPKYYVLGTRGAITGDWRRERLVSRTGIGTVAVDDFAPADAPADLTLVDANGDVTQLAHVQPRAHAFHRELADHLLAGLPMTLDAKQSRDVVAVMEAAEVSAADGGRPVAPIGGLRAAPGHA